jgi:hypothetical protein
MSSQKRDCSPREKEKLFHIKYLVFCKIYEINNLLTEIYAFLESILSIIYLQLTN